MATVTAFTLARAQEVEDANIVSAAVDGSGDLILTRHDGGLINAGNVIGPQGDEGPPGPTGNAIPPGTLIQGNWDGTPAGYVICDGTVLVNGVNTHPDLAAAWPAWVDGNNINLPDLDEKFLMTRNSAPSQTGGANDRILTINQLPAHSHSMQNHTHGRGSFAVDIDHDHGQFWSDYAGEHAHELGTAPSDGAWGQGAPRGSSSGDGYITVTKSNGNHRHIVNPPAYNVADRVVTGTSAGPSHANTGDAGSNQPFDNRPDFFTVRTAVKT